MSNIKAYNQAEPVRTMALLTAAIVATVNLVGFLWSWSADTITLVNVVASAWIAFAGELVRPKVAPNPVTAAE